MCIACAEKKKEKEKPNTKQTKEKALQMNPPKTNRQTNTQANKKTKQTKISVQPC